MEAPRVLATGPLGKSINLETNKQTKKQGKSFRLCQFMCQIYQKYNFIIMGPAQVSPFSKLPASPPPRDPSLCLLLWESRGSRTLGSGCWRCQEEWGILGKSPSVKSLPLSLDSLGWQRNSGEHQRGEKLRGWGRMGTDKGLQIRTAVSTVNYRQTKESYKEEEWPRTQTGTAV